ncbi:MAG: hypothetical protein PHD82_12235 [Candidatus Riflebacteria bacterium]|nr:hypothetical protein [Candidatus Riflebacteria bacterium]
MPEPQQHFIRIRLSLKGVISGLICLLLVTGTLLAESYRSQLQTLEKAVIISIERLESGIELESITGKNFSEKAGRQLEFALLSLDAGHLLQEDYYHFALYVVARHFKHYLSAIELLTYELEMTGQKALKNWLNRRIEQLQKLLPVPEAKMN